MVEFEVMSPMDEQFISLIPRHRAKINDLMNKKKIVSYSLSFDRSRLWAIVRADHAYEVSSILSQLPLTPYMETEITELTFHNALHHWVVPTMSLN